MDKHFFGSNMLLTNFLCDTEINLQNTAFIGEVVATNKNISNDLRGNIEISWPNGNELLNIAEYLNVCWCKKELGTCKVGAKSNN